jgi:hypothetical protein
VCQARPSESHCSEKWRSRIPEVLGCQATKYLKLEVVDLVKEGV